MSHYCDCDYCDESDPEDRSISEKIASRVGDEVQQIVEDLLPVETKALEARLEEMDQELRKVYQELHEVQRTNKQLEYDSGKPYVEQNEEIQRLNSHVANLQAFKVENAALQGALKKSQYGMDVQQANQWRAAVEKERNDAQVEVAELKAQLDQQQRAASAVRIEAAREIAELKEQRRGFEKQIDEFLFSLEPHKEAQAHTISDLYNQINRLKIRLSNCAHWAYICGDPIHALNLIYKEADNAS